MNQLEPLLGTAVMLVAHPDDEVIAFGGLMQRMKRAVVVFATDGAPREPGFWRDYASRHDYAEARRHEARQALAITGAEAVFLSDQVKDGIVDQELFLRLPQAISAFETVVDQVAPASLLTLAYEGGHPDHDACTFVCSRVGQSKKIPVWESPLYHRNSDGSAAVQRFPRLTRQEINYDVEGEAFHKKLEMFHTYKSQKLVLDGFRPEIEQFRPLANYDFTQPPLPCKLNYEWWQWPMSGQEVSAHFASYLKNVSERQEWLNRPTI